MNSSGSTDVTELLIAWSNGDQTALDRLVTLIYAELHRLARRYMQNAGPGNTLQQLRW
jgi:DNA-directed RNA polymerase specialized sigma24 family protein